MSNKPIGLFDSGIGGLSVLREISKQLPQENIIYFADTQHMPYGPRSPQDLRKLVFAILQFLQNQQVKLVIMACNTSSATVLHLARQHFALPILGMIQPTAIGLAKQGKMRVGVMATEATIRSNKYYEELMRAGLDGEIFSQACPKLASLIEDVGESVELESAIREYARPLQQATVDHVILGCTHYPFAARQIAAAFDHSVEIVDPAQYVIREAKYLLSEMNLLNQGFATATYRYYASGNVKQFERRAGRLLGRPISAKRAYFQTIDGRLQVTE